MTFQVNDFGTFTLAEIEAAINSNADYDAFITVQDRHPDNITLDLIGAAYALDADQVIDIDLLELIQDILSMRTNWIARHQ